MRYIVYAITGCCGLDILYIENALDENDAINQAKDIYQNKGYDFEKYFYQAKSLNDGNQIVFEDIDIG